ncbi:MAG TPA: cytochrome c oxidase subunit II [Dokdonella sp.]
MMPASVAARIVAASASAAEPLSYLRAYGPRADRTLPLTWALLVVSIAVVVTICVLVVVALVRSRANVQSATGDGRAVAWVYVGVAASSFLLAGTLVWTVRVLATVNAPSQPVGLTIEVTGEQWWWKVRYLDADPSRTVTTANEIHITTGTPVRVQLVGADVIHSFWVPALAGKTDTVPGQVNTTWIEASQPGRYRGQCTEYCGVQHAHMGFEVVAETPDAFARWLDAQIAPAAAAATPDAQRGEQAFEFRCGACHTVRGTAAGGSTAPDLTHLMSRQTIAAAAAPNEPAMLAAWMANPQAIKPGNHMPTLQLSGAELGEIEAYLLTLH